MSTNSVKEREMTVSDIELAGVFEEVRVLNPQFSDQIESIGKHLDWADTMAAGYVANKNMTEGHLRYCVAGAVKGTVSLLDHSAAHFNRPALTREVIGRLENITQIPGTEKLIKDSIKTLQGRLSSMEESATVGVAAAPAAVAS